MIGLFDLTVSDVGIIGIFAMCITGVVVAAVKGIKFHIDLSDVGKTKDDDDGR